MFKCDKCGKEFNTQAGLDQHNADKHGISSHDRKALKRHEQEKQKSDTGRKEKSRKMGKYAVVAVVVVVAIVGAYFLMSGSSGTPSNNNDNILNTNLYSHNSLALHIHPHLEIEINGQKETIPTSVGISGSVMRVIHTHDDTGKLHVESPVPHTFVLQDFFTIWSKTFSSDCIFEYCNNATHELRVTVNGQPNMLFGEVPLKDLDNIRIVYGPKQ